MEGLKRNGKEILNGWRMRKFLRYRRKGRGSFIDHVLKCPNRLHEKLHVPYIYVANDKVLNTPSI
jgi:hypothetical protein